MNILAYLIGVTLKCRRRSIGIRNFYSKKFTCSSLCQVFILRDHHHHRNNFPYSFRSSSVRRFWIKWIRKKCKYYWGYSFTHSLAVCQHGGMIKYSFYKILINKQISEFEIISEKFINKCFALLLFPPLFSHTLAYTKNIGRWWEEN